MIKKLAKNLSLFFISISIVAVGAADLMASTEKTPDVETILAKHIDALGGKAAFEKINTKVTEMTINVPAKKTEIKTTTFMQRPNKVYSVSEFVMLGKTITTKAGMDGEVVWEEYPIRKRLLSGTEKERRIMDWAFDGSVVNWKTYFKDAKVLGVEDVEGKSCYKVSMAPVDGQGADMIFFFDKDNFLMTKVIREMVTPKKTSTVEVFLTDYKKVDDLMVPHTVKSISEGEEPIITTINSIKANVDIPADKFELPEKIKELVKEQG